MGGTAVAMHGPRHPEVHAMSRRALLAISAGLTAFVSILIGAVAAFVLKTAAVPASASNPPPEVPAAVAPASFVRDHDDDRHEGATRHATHDGRRHGRHGHDDG